MSKTHNALKQEKKRGKKLSLINCTKSEKEMGITLIALIITIVVLIILAVISLNAVFGSDGIIESARRSEIMNSFSTFKEQVNTFNAEKELASEEYSVESLTAGQTSLIYNTQGEDTSGNIQTVIPSMSDDYAEKFEIIKGELLLYASSQLEYDIAVGMGIKVSPYIIVDGVLLSANANLGLQTTDGVVTLPERVTEIGAGAFSGVEGLKEIIIPGTVKVIQADAFSYNAEIEKVTMQYGVESIGEYAFKECSSLKEVVMPDSVIEVGIEAFYRCTNLGTVQLSNNITTLLDSTFRYCTNLTTVNIPSNVASIGGNVFGSCSKLNNIYIPDGVTNITSSAFEGCTSLYNLTIGEANATYIIEGGIIYAKDNSTLIMLAPIAEQETVTIREGIQKLDGAALSICTNMKILNLPSTLSSISGQTFDGITVLERINFPLGNSNYIAEDGYLYGEGGKTLIYVVPTKVDVNINENVEIIEVHAIQGKNITELIIPDNVTTLRNFVFFNTTNLQKIEIGSGVSDLSSQFKSWSSIPIGYKLTIDSDNQKYKVEGNLILTKDGKEVITYVDNIQSQIVPEGVEILADYAFSSFYIATEIVLPSTLQNIGNFTFESCTSLTEIEIPNNVENIAGNAFLNCSNLATIKIDKSQGSIIGAPWSVPKGDRAIIWLR